MIWLIFSPLPKPSADNGSSKSSPEKSTEKENDKTPIPPGTMANLKTKIEESQKKAEHVRDDIRGYALDRFINYVKNYDKVLEKKFPGAMKVYRVFMDGVKFFGRDMVDYVKIRTRMVVNGKDFASMSRRELELYYQMPNNIWKAGPLLLISAIPFAHYVTMPIA